LPAASEFFSRDISQGWPIELTWSVFLPVKSLQPGARMRPCSSIDLFFFDDGTVIDQAGMNHHYGHFLDP
jgi:hypothetical protein